MVSEIGGYAIHPNYVREIRSKGPVICLRYLYPTPYVRVQSTPISVGELYYKIYPFFKATVPRRDDEGVMRRVHKLSAQPLD